MDKNTSQSNSLKLAQEGLQFEDIFQKSVEANISNNFEPKYALQENEQEIGVQFKHAVLNSLILKIKSAAEQNKTIFRVNIAVGIRYIKESDPVAQIEAKYSVDYLLVDEKLLDNKEALNEFALKNASYHLWPFWREFAMSQAQRMNLPSVPLPLRLPQ